MTFTSNDFAGVAPFATTVSATHTLQVKAPTSGHIWADVEEPLGTRIIMEAEASDGKCARATGWLDQHPSGYYGFFAEVTDYQSGTGQAWVADPNRPLPPCAEW